MSSKNRDTRGKILKATWKLLEKGQGSEVRMSDIAKEAGVSRQAVYMHFPTRTDLLVATTLYLDEVKNVDERLAASRSAETGVERIDAFMEAWGNYIPEIYGVAKALMIMGDTDEAARNAWDGRLQAVRDGCRVAIKALKRDEMLVQDYTVDDATDLLSALLSVRTWEHLTSDCGWSQETYMEKIKLTVRRSIMRDSTVK